MRLPSALLTCLIALGSQQCLASGNGTALKSRQILPSSFKPPQVFKNINLVRNINLEKSYPRETINVVIENIDSSPQDEYFLPFEAGVVERIGGLEVRDKKDVDRPAFWVETVEYDTHRLVNLYSDCFVPSLMRV